MSASFAPQFVPYENFTLGIRIKYPADWLKQDQPGIPLVGFFSPPEGPMDFFRENLTVAVEELAPGVTLQQYVDRSLAAARTNMPNFNIIASQSASLANLPAYEMLFTWSPGPILLQCRLLTVLKGNRSYSINYTAESGKYEKFLPAAQTMIDSFEIG
jgi:hypothetical protein